MYTIKLRAEHIIKARGALAPRGRAALCKGGGIEKGRRRGGAGRRRGALRPPRGAGACGGCGRAEEVRAARRAAGQRALVATGTNGEPAGARAEAVEEELRERKRGALREHVAFCEDMRDGVRAAETWHGAHAAPTQLLRVLAESQGHVQRVELTFPKSVNVPKNHL